MTEYFPNYFAAKEQNEGDFDMEDLKECEELSLDKMAFKVHVNTVHLLTFISSSRIKKSALFSTCGARRIVFLIPLLCGAKKQHGCTR